MKKIKFCTGNKSKLDEANNLIDDLKLSNKVIFEEEKICFTEIQSLSQKEILLDKMRQARKHTKEPFIIDETGLYFKRYNEYPGTLTKYIFKALNFEGIEKLIKNEDNSAFFKTTILYSPDGENYTFTEGTLEGKIVIKDNKVKDSNFPFSSIFIPEGYNDYLINLYKNNDFFDHRKKALLNAIKNIDL